MLAARANANPEYVKLLLARLNLVGRCHPIELVGVAGLELTGHTASEGTTPWVSQFGQQISHLNNNV